MTACTQLVPREEDTTSPGSLRGRPTKTDDDDDDDDFRACDVTAQPLEKVETAADIAPSCDAACRRSCRELHGEEIRQRPKEKVWLRFGTRRGREGGAGVREAVCRELHERRDGPVRFPDTVSVLNRFF